MENKGKYFIVEYNEMSKKFVIAKITKDGKNFYDYCYGELSEAQLKEEKTEDYNDFVGRSINIGKYIDTCGSQANYSIEMTDEPINQAVCEIANKKSEIKNKYGENPNSFTIHEKSKYPSSPEGIVDYYFEKLDVQNIKYSNYIKNIIKTMANDFNFCIEEYKKRSCYKYPEQIISAISGLYFVLDEVIKSLKDKEYLYLPIYEYGTHPDFKTFAQKVYEVCGERIVPRLSFELLEERYLAGDKTYTPENLTCHPVLSIGKNETRYDADIADSNIRQYKVIKDDNIYSVVDDHRDMKQKTGICPPTYIGKDITIRCPIEEKYYIDEVVKYLRENYKKVMDFFNITNLDKPLEIKIWDNKSEFKEEVSKITGYELPDWSIGTGENGKDDEYSRVDFLSLPEIRSIDYHKEKTSEDLRKGILHEFVHVCHEQASNYNTPKETYKTEGVATYLADQYENAELNVPFEDLIKDEDYVEYQNYRAFFDTLVNSFSHEDVLKFINTSNKEYDDEIISVIGEALKTKHR